MARNGSGTAIPPVSVNPVAPGTVITSNWANTTITDTYNELTNSLPRDGQAPMLAPLKITDGSVTIPGLSFNAESATGLYRVSPGVGGFAVGGVQSFTFSSSGISGSLTGNVTGAASLNVLKTGDTMTGNLGIGGSPSNRLDIQSSALSTTPLVVRNFSNGGTILKVGNASNGNGTLQVLAGDGATSQMLLDSSANLGLGRTPSTNLDVQSSSAAAIVRVRGGASSSQGAAFYVTQGGTDTTLMAFGDNAAINGRAVSTTASIWTSSSIPLAFQVGGSERARIDTAGNLGIGMIPSAWRSGAKALQFGTFGSLNVQQNGSVSLAFAAYEGSNNVFNYTTTGDWPTRYRQITGAHYWDSASAGTVGGTVSFNQNMVLDANGNLGIGVASPGTRRLVIGGAQYPDTVIKSNVASGSVGSSTLYFGNSSTDGEGYLSFDHAAYVMSFGVRSGSEKMRIDSNGNLLIGTTSAALSSAGRGLIELAGTASAYYGLKVSGVVGGYTRHDGTTMDIVNNINGDLNFYTAAAFRMKITAGGVIQDSSGNELGYKGIPLSSNAWVPGQCNVVTAGATINTGGAAGATYSIYNNGGTAITLTQGSGLTLRQGGTTNTGNRTILPNGFATIWFINSTNAVINGNIT